MCIAGSSTMLGPTTPWYWLNSWSIGTTRWSRIERRSGASASLPTGIPNGPTARTSRPDGSGIEPSESSDAAHGELEFLHARVFERFP